MKRTIYIGAGSDNRLEDYLSEKGNRVIRIGTEGVVSAPVSDHPDMFMCRLGIRDDSPLVSCFDLPSCEHMSGSASVPGLRYPEDIIYNAACTGKYFIHNLKHTAPELLSAAESLGMKLIDVRQGYTKCSTVIVDEDSIITYDRGIAAPCLAAGMDVLLVSPGHVALKGYDTGFIGGSSGLVDGTLIFNGNLSSHPDFDRIKEFTREHGVSIKWFSDWELTDTGSII